MKNQVLDNTSQYALYRKRKYTKYWSTAQAH